MVEIDMLIWGILTTQYLKIILDTVLERIFEGSSKIYYVWPFQN